MINPACEQRAEREIEGRVLEDTGAVVDDDSDHGQRAEADA